MWILVIVLAEDSVLWILSLRNDVCGIMEFAVLSVLLAIGSASSVPSRDGGQVKIRHQITFRIPIGCWRSPYGL